MAGDVGQVCGNAFVELAAEYQCGHSDSFEYVEDVPTRQGPGGVVIRVSDHRPECQRAHQFRVQLHRRGADDMCSKVFLLGGQIVGVVGRRVELTSVGAFQYVAR